MATLNAVILPGKALKGGRHKVRVSVAHNGEFRYILTDIILDSAKEFRHGQIVKRPDAALLNAKLRGIIDKCQRAIDNLPYINGLTCPELVREIQEADKYRCRTLQSVYDEYISYLHVRESSLKVYAGAYASITQCIRPDMRIEGITHATILAYDRFLRDHKMSTATIRFRISFLGSLVKYAVRCGYAQYRSDPFLGYRAPSAQVRKAWLTVEQVRAIRDYTCKSRCTMLVKDLFMLSYYLGGININDLRYMTFDAGMETISYVRRKTEGRQKVDSVVSFSLPDEAKAIIARITRADGRIRMTDAQRNGDIRTTLALQLRKIKEALGLPRLIYYSARKSFAQHALELGARAEVIDYILGHSMSRSGCLYNYVYVTPQLATDTIRMVLDNLR